MWFHYHVVAHPTGAIIGPPNRTTYRTRPITHHARRARFIAATAHLWAHRTAPPTTPIHDIEEGPISRGHRPFIGRTGTYNLSSHVHCRGFIDFPTFSSKNQ